MKYVYEFTNGRKVTKKEFIHWFEKKFLYTLRKFHMIKKGDIIIVDSKGDFRGVVLEHLMKMFAEKSPVRLIKKGKFTKKAITATTDTEAVRMTNILLKASVNSLNELKPVNNKVIKPLFLFLDKEVLLYAKLIGLKFKAVKEITDRLSMFVNDMEKKHPEIKHSIIKSYLDLYSAN
jgi:hypothetical protein